MQTTEAPGWPHHFRRGDTERWVHLVLGVLPVEVWVVLTGEVLQLLGSHHTAHCLPTGTFRNSTLASGMPCMVPLSPELDAAAGVGAERWSCGCPLLRTHSETRWKTLLWGSS